MRISTGIFVSLCFFTTFCGCIANSGAKRDAEAEAAFPHLVISRADFDANVGKPCKHTRECASPLVCAAGKCAVPPSITGREAPDTPRITVETASGKHTVLLEVVDDEYTMARGLMMRRICQPGWGMLFVYPNEDKRSFWMQNTFIALDMAFIRADGSVANVVRNAEPLNNVPRYESTDRVK